MIDKSKTYRTRDGREVRIYATDGRDFYPVHGAIDQGDGWQQNCWTKNGQHSLNKTTCYDGSDLIEVRPRHKRTVWLNVHPDNEYAAFGERAEADEVAYERIACIKVDLDFCEGDGL